MADIELNTKIFRKDNLDIVYSVTGKKHLNGILHYKLKSDNSEEILKTEIGWCEPWVFTFDNSKISDFKIYHPDNETNSKLPKSPTF